MTDLVHTRITARIRSPPGNVSPAKRHVASPESGVVFIFANDRATGQNTPGPGHIRNRRLHGGLRCTGRGRASVGLLVLLSPSKQK